MHKDSEQVWWPPATMWQRLPGVALLRPLRADSRDAWAQSPPCYACACACWGRCDGTPL